MNRDTICVQGGYTPGNGEPRQIPIIQSTTFKYATSEDMGKLFDLEADGYFYSRLQNPTCDLVAKKICELEGGTAAMLTSSGQAANFFALFNLCEAGDHIVASSTIYGGTFNLISVTMKKMGIEATFVDPLCTEEELNAAFRPNTKVVFGETIANPALTVLDIEKFAKAAHAHGVPLIVDNTFPTPVNCRPFEWGADIVTHSTTTDDAEVDGYKLMWFAVHTSNMTTSTSVVRLELDGQQFEAVCSGDGPVDAAFEAIDQIIRPVEHSFDLYRINSISPGKDTMGDVSVKLSCDNRTFSGRGLHTNIVEASVRAYISAMNKLRAYAARRAKGEV